MVYIFNHQLVVSAQTLYKILVRYSVLQYNHLSYGAEYEKENESVQLLKSLIENLTIYRIGINFLYL